MIRLGSDMRCMMCMPSKPTNFHLDEIQSVAIHIVVSPAHAFMCVALNLPTISAKPMANQPK
jgi:hypothetical protein